MLSHTRPHSDPTSEAQLEVIAERFFNASREAGEPGQQGDDVSASSMSKSERRAMRATLAMLGLFGVGLGAFVVYTRLIMPVPAEIGLERAIELPVPASASGLEWSPDSVPPPSAAEIAQPPSR